MSTAPTYEPFRPACFDLVCHEVSDRLVFVAGSSAEPVKGFITCDKHARDAVKLLGEKYGNVTCWTTYLEPADLRGRDIVYLEANSSDLQYLHRAVTWAVEKGRHFRVAMDGRAFKFKPGEDSWSPPITSHRENGGY